MIIVGAKGLAKEVLEIFYQHDSLNKLYFFDNVSTDLPKKLFDRFPILTTMEEVTQVFRDSNEFEFTLGLGSPKNRLQLTRLFEAAGGALKSAISKNAFVGNFGTRIGEGCTILDGAVVTNGVSIGKGCLINPHCSLSHDVWVGDYVEISPGARLTGSCEIGNFCVIGTNAVILPKIKIGKNVVVGAGAVVTKDVADNSLVVGVPAQVKMTLPPFNG